MVASLTQILTISQKFLNADKEIWDPWDLVNPWSKLFGSPSARHLTKSDSKSNKIVRLRKPHTDLNHLTEILEHR